MEHSKCSVFDNRIDCEGEIEWVSRDMLYGCRYDKKCNRYQIKYPLELLSKYETESKGIREGISKAARTGDRDIIKQLMARGPKLQNKISMLRTYLDKTVKSSRPECKNTLCDLKGFKDGLEDPITSSCEDPKDLIKLSDDYCYSKSDDGIKKGMGYSSGRESRKNMINIDYTLKDYETMRVIDGRTHYYNQKYNTYFYQYQDLCFDLQQDQFELSFLEQIDDCIKNGDEINEEVLDNLSELLANSNGIDLEIYRQWIRLDNIMDIFDIENNLRIKDVELNDEFLKEKQNLEKQEKLTINKNFIELLLDGYDIDEIVRKASKTHGLSKEKYKEIVEYDYIYQILHPENEFRRLLQKVSEEVNEELEFKQELKDKMQDLLESDYHYYYRALEKLGFLGDSLEVLEKKLPYLGNNEKLKEFRKKYIETEKDKNWLELVYLKILHCFYSPNDITRQTSIKPSFDYFKEALGSDKPKIDKYLFLGKFKEYVNLMSETIKKNR